MSKKRKKKNKKSIDLGSQELVRNEDHTLTRKVDGEVFRFAFYGEDRHLEKVHKSVLENYHARGMLCNYDRNVNDKDFGQVLNLNKYVITQAYSKKLQLNLQKWLLGLERILL